MPRSDFYAEYDESTELKLALFRRYTAEWLSVFLTRRIDGGNSVQMVQIYDFFAGPGQDRRGNLGSPLIILDELKRYCIQRSALKAGASARLYFNDEKANHITRLRAAVEASACDRGCCGFEFTSLSFAEAFQQQLPRMNAVHCANLVIMDQFGLREVTPDVVRTLAACPRTDFLFFVSTSYIRRFGGTPEIVRIFGPDILTQLDSDYNVVHRRFCEFLRNQLDDDGIYLAPFSIKKGPNIYGIIFGSRHPLGIEKFLDVCWDLDGNTGEANYNIDSDLAYAGQLSIFPEENRFRKIDLFTKDLLALVRADHPDNIAVSRFCLTSAVSLTKARELLVGLQREGKITVVEATGGSRARRGAFYLRWAACDTGIPRVRFLPGDPQ